MVVVVREASLGIQAIFRIPFRPHSSYHTSPCAAPAPAPPGPPGVMSVAELVRQPGRDHLPYLTPYPHGRSQTWFNRSGNGISAWINRMMYSALDKGHPTFTDFPTDKQHLWFRQFAQEFKNSPGIPMRRSLSVTTSSIKLWTTTGSRSTSGKRRIEPSEYTEGHLPRNIPRDPVPLNIPRDMFVGTSEDWTIGKSIEISRRSSPSVYSEELSDELVVLRISSEICFLGIPSENSEGFPKKNEFPRSYFRGLVSSVCRRNNVIPTTY
uniref:Uncharacterized protein n=1 Tax=Brassica oleracea var. oleracea TaxID=109376 RepID=A0A0D3EEP2_BRAOL